MRFLLVVLLSLGLFFRVADLNHKVYWYDETFTALRASGYTEAEVVQHFATASIVNAAALQHYQQPAADRGVVATWQSLATEDNQHPPFYYTLANLWSRLAGSSVAASRLLPALLSLLGLPAVYWLCQELFYKTGPFHTRLPAWIGVALFAISPFQVIYAQEARQYSLWSTVTLLMTAALLRAIRVQSLASWGLYALMLVLNLYTFLLSGFVIAGHSIYVLLRDNWGWRSSWRYLTATLCGVVLFLPWGWVLLHNLSQAESVTHWTSAHLSWPTLGLTWVSIIGRIFYDRGTLLLDRMVQASLVLLVGYAFYCLCRNTARRVWLLIVTLSVMPVLPLMLADLGLGGLRSTFPRYFIPTLLGVQLAVVYLFSEKLSNPLPSTRQRWQWIAAALCGAGLISCIASWQAPTWWQKTLSQENLAVAALVNQADRPLLVSDAETGDLLSLSHALKPEVALLIRPRCSTCRIPAAEALDATLSPFLTADGKNYRSVFLFHPRSSKIWRRSLKSQQNLGFELIALNDQPNNKVLWRIVNK